MSWIESHQSLLTHRKTIRAATELGISKYLLIGHLHALWWWALDNLDDQGCLLDLTDAEIAHAAGWPRKAPPFVQALTLAGFIDGALGRRGLHDWWQYAGKLNAKRATDRARKSPRLPTELQGKSQAPTNQPTNQPTDSTNHTNRLDAVGAAFACFGKVTSGTVQAIEGDVEDFSLEWVEKAVRVAAKGGFDDKPAWSYVSSILDRWKKQGGTDDERLQATRQPARRGARSADDPASVVAGWERYAAGED